MGRAPCCDKANVKRGPWSPDEDMALKNYVEKYGTGGNWISLPHKAGLKRCGKSCRLRWLNYLRPDIKHGGFTEEEDHIICSLYKNIGSRWSVIASQLQGRTDNDVKNYWNTKLKKKRLAGKINLTTPNNNIQPTSPCPSMLNAPQSDNQGFPLYLEQNPTTMPILSMDSNVSHDFGSLGIQYPIPGASEFTSNNIHIASSCSDGSSLSIPSPLPLDNNFNSWWLGNGIDEDDSFFMDIGFGSSYDLLSGPAAAPSTSNYTFFDSFLSNTSDAKPFQSITN